MQIFVVPRTIEDADAFRSAVVQVFKYRRTRPNGFAVTLEDGTERTFRDSDFIWFDSPIAARRHLESVARFMCDTLRQLADKWSEIAVKQSLEIQTIQRARAAGSKHAGDSVQQTVESKN